MVYRRTFDERFWPRIVQTETCWLWTGSCTQSGYGQMCFEGRTTGAHRASYMTFVGPIPEGLELDHLCRVRNCVNPEHLEPVTAAENKRRAAAAITHCLRGHEFTESNVLVSSGRRRCRQCGRDASKARALTAGLAREASRAAHLERVRVLMAVSS